MSATVNRLAIPQSLQSFDAMPGSAWVRLPTVCGLYGVSAATVWRWVREKRMVAPQKRGQRVTVWSVEALRADLAAKVA